MWLFRISPTLNIKQGTPSRWQITALRENNKVWARFLGRDNFAVELSLDMIRRFFGFSFVFQLTENNADHELTRASRREKGGKPEAKWQLDDAAQMD